MIVELIWFGIGIYHCIIGEVAIGLTCFIMRHLIVVENKIDNLKDKSPLNKGEEV